MLHEIDEIRVYCGPAALMAVTGKRLPEVRAVINKVRERRENQGVCGLSTTHLDKALQSLGVKFERIEFPKEARVTLKEFKHRMVIGATYIIGLNTHYVSCEDGKLIDNHYRFGTDMDDCKWKNKRVENAWMIWHDQ